MRPRWWLTPSRSPSPGAASPTWSRMPRGHGHTDAFPVPQAPVGVVEDVDPAVAYAPVDEVAQFMPQPRDPGDGVVDPSTYAQAVGAHAAAPQDVAPEEAVDVPGPDARWLEQPTPWPAACSRT